MNTKALSTQVNDSSSATFDLAHFYHLLLSKAWVIILCFVLTLLGGVAYLIWAPKVTNRRLSSPSSRRRQRSTTSRTLSESAADIKGPEVLKTIEQASVESDLAPAGCQIQWVGQGPLIRSPQERRYGLSGHRAGGRFKSKVNVKLRRGTRLVDVTVEDKDPQRAQRLGRVDDQRIRQSEL